MPNPPIHLIQVLLFRKCSIRLSLKEIGECTVVSVQLKLKQSNMELDSTRKETGQRRPRHKSPCDLNNVTARASSALQKLASPGDPTSEHKHFTITIITYDKATLYL